MEVVLFAVYLLLFCWCVTATRFFRNSGLSRFQLMVLFLLKVAMGVAYGWINWFDGAQPGQTDTWALHAESLKETKILLTSPVRAITSFFYNPYTNSFGSLFASSDSYWNNLKNNTYIRIESLFNCFSFGSYFINIIFYSFLTFFGVVAVYRVMRHHLQGSRLLLLIGCFLVPSFLYWTSGLHKDGLTFLALGTIIYILYFRTGKRRPVASYLLLPAALLLLFALRNHILLVLLPALICWILATRFPRQRLWIFAAVYLLGGVFFFTAKYLWPALDFPAIVLSKQEAFNHTGGGSSLTVSRLRPDFAGFMQQLPGAISRSAFRPFVSDLKKPVIYPAFIELLLTGCCILLFLFFPRKKTFRPFSLFLLVFAFSILLMIGYTVNNLSAVVRYRSILFPLILPPVLLGTDWKKLARKLNIKIN
ncbi:hypothetical protein [Niabella beijingensis]|uniref:hypothetical protein n=1 Tax=Niabella beijingensis TaxID=2872700 RepID=UPI001CBB19E4|nr:hypothetical protein [Niabella beijingensis]MBZ4190602.1 hypothetical protein [Niabella beijingensis]